MQIIRCLTLAVIAALVTGCSSFTRESGQTLPRDASWGVAPLVNYAQAPQLSLIHI